MYFEPDTAVLDAAQALCVALPAAGLPALLSRFGGRGWSLLAPSGAAASKLRQLVPALEASLHEQGWQPTPIRIKVQSA